MQGNQFMLELPFQVSTSHILDHFISSIEHQQQLSLNRKYQILQKDQNQIIAIKENVAVLKNTFKRLVCLQEDPYEQVCLVKLLIETNQVKCVRVITIKAITGSHSENEALIEHFSRALNRMNNKNAHDLVNDASEFVSFMNVSEEMENPAHQNPYYLETSAYYMFHKLLCATNYGLGKKVNEFIFKMRQNLQQDSLITLKQNVQHLNQYINQIVETLFQSFNFGKPETSQIMPFCRISVEKYFYLKLKDVIFPQYQQNYEKYNEEFRKRTHELSQEQVMKQLELENFSENQKLRLNEAIQEIKRIKLMIYPREKLKCFQMMNAVVKSTFPNSIDKISKYCLIFSEMEYPYSEIHLLIDATSSQDKYFLQKLNQYFDEIVQMF